MRAMRRFACATICLLAPRVLKPALLRLCGHPVARDARIGLSLVAVEMLAMGAGATIGTGNILILRRCLLRAGARVGHLNAMRRGFSIVIGAKGKIGNRNVAVGGLLPDRRPPAVLRLGGGATLTSGHYLNVTESIHVGDHTTIAGIGCQFWTHGFIHDDAGAGRSLVTGPIRIGRNVYLGSATIVTCGVRIGDNVSTGVATSVVKDLTQAGLYVAGPLRKVARTAEQRRAALQAADAAQGTRAYRRLPRPPPLPRGDLP